MKLTDDIFNNLNGKASSVFTQCDVSTYLEIGVREGTTFTSRINLVRKKLVAIDCWDLFQTPSQNDMKRSREEAKKQYERLSDKYQDSDKVEIIKSFSNNMETISKFNDNYFNVIFIDGDHSYEGVKEDLNNWWNKCNTLFCGHDYMTTKTVWNGVECGVKRAVDEFVIEKNHEINRFRVFSQSSNPTWFIWKK